MITVVVIVKLAIVIIGHHGYSKGRGGPKVAALGPPPPPPPPPSPPPPPPPSSSPPPLSQLATVDGAGSTPIDHERNKYLVRRIPTVSTPNEDFLLHLLQNHWVNFR